jgi:hypothetical protein
MCLLHVGAVQQRKPIVGARDVAMLNGPVIPTRGERPRQNLKARLRRRDPAGSHRRRRADAS